MELLHRLRSDEALMLRYAESDIGAFEVLYQRHKDALYSFLLRSGCERSRAEDLAQETWSAVIGAAAGYQAKAGFKTWLYTIARRKLVDDWRRQQSRITESEAVDAADPAKAGDGLMHVQASRLLCLIGELPSEQREVFLLKEEGFSLQEIAEVTEVGLETVRSRLRYARSSLRDAMGEVAYA